MYKKRLLFCVVCFLLVIVSAYSADCIWGNSQGDQDWTEPLNWSPTVPGSSDNAFISGIDSDSAILDGYSAEAYDVSVGFAYGEGRLLLQNGASLSTHKVDVGTDGQHGFLEMHDSEISGNYTIWFGVDNGSDANALLVDSVLSSYFEIRLGGAQSLRAEMTLVDSDVLITHPSGRDFVMSYFGESFFTMKGNSNLQCRQFQIGRNAAAHVDLEGDSEVNISDKLYLGYNQNSSGTLNVKDNAQIFTNFVIQSNNANTNSGILNVYGGKISCASRYYLGYWSYGELNMFGGEVESGDRIFSGYKYNGNGVINLHAGTIKALNSSSSSNALEIGTFAAGSLNMDGGLIQLGGNLMIASESGSTGTVTMSAGTIEAENVLFGLGDGSFEITGSAEIVLEGDRTGNINQYINEGKITSGPDSRVISVDYDGEYTYITVDQNNLKRAWSPDPVGNIDGNQYANVVLTWLAGDNAESHDLYFSTDYESVAANDTTSFVNNFEAGNESFESGNVELDTTYYWKVNEHENGNVWEGKIWSFTVLPYYTIEDFESYTSDTELQSVWTGDITAELDLNLPIDDFSTKAMGLDYSTSSSPYKNEITKEFATPEDWTILGLKSIQMWGLGYPDNEAEVLYVSLKDASNNEAAVYFDDIHLTRPDWITSWTRIYFELDAFSGVDLSQVKSVTIGIGNGTADGGQGQFTIDNIRLYIPVWVYEESVNRGDFNASRFVDLKDFSLFSKLWGEQSETPQPVDPGSNGLRVYYDFENDPNLGTDMSGNGFDAEAISGTAVRSYDAERDSHVLNMDPAKGGARVNMQILDSTNAMSTLDAEVTISFWAYGADSLPYDNQIFYGIGEDERNGRILFSHLPLRNGIIYWDSGHPYGTNSSGTYDRVTYLCWEPSEFKGKWNHYAFVKNSETGFKGIYINGELVSVSYEAYGNMTGVTDFSFGRGQWEGLMDDFIIYDRQLSSGEILYLADQSSITEELPYDMNNDGLIDVIDLEKYIENWLSEALWP